MFQHEGTTHSLSSSYTHQYGHHVLTSHSVYSMDNHWIPTHSCQVMNIFIVIYMKWNTLIKFNCHANWINFHGNGYNLGCLSLSFLFFPRQNENNM